MAKIYSFAEVRKMSTAELRAYQEEQDRKYNEHLVAESRRRDIETAKRDAIDYVELAIRNPWGERAAAYLETQSIRLDAIAEGRDDTEITKQVIACAWWTAWCDVWDEIGGYVRYLPRDLKPLRPT